MFNHGGSSSSSSSSYHTSRHYVGQPQVTTTRYTTTSGSVPGSILTYPSILQGSSPLSPASSRITYHSSSGLMSPIIPSTIPMTTTTSTSSSSTSKPRSKHRSKSITTTETSSTRGGMPVITTSTSSSFLGSGGGGGFYYPTTTTRPLIIPTTTSSTTSRFVSSTPQFVTTTSGLFPSLVGGFHSNQLQHLGQQTGQQVTTRVQRFEWKVCNDGVLRQVLVHDSTNTEGGSSSRSSSTNSSSEANSTRGSMEQGSRSSQEVTFSTTEQQQRKTKVKGSGSVQFDSRSSQELINPPLIVTQPLSSTATKAEKTTNARKSESFSSVDSTRLDSSSNDDVSSRDVSKTAVMRMINMKAAANQIMIENKRKQMEEEFRKSKADEVARRAQLEQEVAKIKQDSLKAQELETRMRSMVSELEQIKAVQTSAQSEEVRKLQEEMQRMKMQSEAFQQEQIDQRLRGEHENRMRLEEELKKLREAEKERLRMIEIEIENKRREEEAERKASLEAEIRRLQEEELKRVQQFKEELRRIQEKNEGDEKAEDLRRSQEEDIKMLKAQQNVLTQTIRLEEEAGKKTVDPGKFVAIDHPFNCLMLKIHSFVSEFEDTTTDNLAICKVTLGKTHLQSESQPNNGGRVFEWDDLFTFPYLNEKFIKIKLVNSQSSFIGGVKVDMEHFLLHPEHNCGRHEIQILNQESEAVGPLTLSLFLSTDFLDKAYISVRSRKTERQTSNESVIASSKAIKSKPSLDVKSSIVNPYKAIKIFLYETQEINIPVAKTMFTCRLSVGPNSLACNSIPEAAANAEKIVFDSEFGFMYDNEKIIRFDLTDLSNSSLVVGTSDIDLENLLSSRVDTHSVMIPFTNPTTMAYVGCLSISLEFLTKSLVNCYSKQTSTTISEHFVPNMSSTFDGPPHIAVCPPLLPSVNMMMPSMMQQMLSSSIAGGASATAHSSSSSSSSFRQTSSSSSSSSKRVEGSSSVESDFGINPGMNIMQSYHEAQSQAQISRPTTCKVQVFSCRNIRLVQAGGKSDATLQPYVKVFLGDLEARTPPSSKGPNPHWKSGDGCFIFDINVDQIFKDMEAGKHDGMLRFEGWNKKSPKDEFIGFAELSVAPLFNNTSGTFSGDLQFTRIHDNVVVGTGIVNVSVQSF